MRVLLAWLAPLVLLASCGYHTGLAPRVPRPSLPEDAIDDPGRLGLEGAATEANATSATRTIGRPAKSGAAAGTTTTRTSGARCCCSRNFVRGEHGHG